MSTMAVRNILACRVAQKDRGFSESSMNSREKYDAIVKFVGNALDVVSHFFWFVIQKKNCFRRTRKKEL